MIKQLVANGRSSYNDFGIYIKERKISPPSKRINRQSVPGMHGSYDFSSIYGEVIYNDRIIEYKFDVTGWDVEDLDEERRKIFDWIMNINETKIIDEYSPNYHWYGSYSEGSWSEDAEQGLLSIKFVVYPFAISNKALEVNFDAAADKKTIIIENNSSHRVMPKIITDGEINVETETGNFSLTEGEWEVDNFYLKKGSNTLLVSGSANVCIKYYEEVL